MVELQPSKLVVRVRFPSPAQSLQTCGDFGSRSSRSAKAGQAFNVRRVIGSSSAGTVASSRIGSPSRRALTISGNSSARVPVAGARDRVEAQTRIHAAFPGSGTGRMRGSRDPAHRRPRRWARTSAPNTSRALCRNRTAPSGRPHAPRPRTSSAQRFNRPNVASPPRPATTCSAAPADRREAVHARPALARRLSGEPTQNVGRLGPAAGVFGNDRQHTRSDDAPDRRETARLQRNGGGDLGREPGPRVAADQDASHSSWRAPGSAHHVADLRADLDLVHAWMRDAAGHRDEHRAGHLIGPDRMNDVGPKALIRARCPSVSTFWIKVGRPRPRERTAAGRTSESPDHRSAGGRGNAPPPPRSWSESAPRGRARLAERPPNAPARPPRSSAGHAAWGASTDDHLIGIHGGRGELRAVEHEVRAKRHQDPVLLARRLPFAPVHDDDGTPLPTADRAHLDGRRERRAATAAQTGGVDRVDQLGAGASMRRRRRRNAARVRAGSSGRPDRDADSTVRRWRWILVAELLTARPRCSRRRR